MTKGMIILRGLPASGKSTYARGMVSTHPDEYVRVNRDDLRVALYGKQYGPGIDERVITAAQDAAIRTAIDSGRTVIVDNMNVRPQYVKGLYKIAQEFGVEPIVLEFKVDLETAIRRDSERDERGGHLVGEKALRGLYRRYVDGKGNYPALPAFEPEPTFQPYERVEDGRPTCIIVDIDGTLAHMTGRSPYDPTRYDEDEPDYVVYGIVQAWRRRFDTHVSDKVFLLSGRNENHRDATEAWLSTYGFKYDQLFMRPSDQPYRKDSHVKNDLFEEHIAGKYNVDFILDDRDQVVDMWRAKGLKCLQVAEGSF